MTARPVLIRLKRLLRPVRPLLLPVWRPIGRIVERPNPPPTGPIVLDLGDRQAVAFREVRRIARHAIISLPIDWEMDDPTNAHHQLSNETALSWFAPVVPTRVKLGNPGPRLVYVFENLAG